MLDEQMIGYGNGKLILSKKVTLVYADTWKVFRILGRRDLVRSTVVFSPYSSRRPASVLSSACSPCSGLHRLSYGFSDYPVCYAMLARLKCMCIVS